jgi:cation diffusion facilitator CzcD-associated flavoprotein CzcO
MPSATQDPTALVEVWLTAYQAAVQQADASALTALLLPDSHWRDVLALTWSLRTTSGAAAIAPLLLDAAHRAGMGPLRVAAGRTPPRRVTRAGESSIEAILSFETEQGRCEAVLRLRSETPRGEMHKAWSLVTVLDELKGHEEATGKRRPTGSAYSKDFTGPNWLDRRRAAVAFAEREPAVLVVGAGQAGLSIAARLTMLGIDTLVVERNARIGDNWRKRYHALSLHNQVHVNHLPYIPFPPGWPTYIPKDKLAGWLEAYAESLELNVWTGTKLTGGRYDERERQWSVEVRRADGSVRRLRPRHLVLATSASAIPHVPDIPTLERFAGSVMHSSRFGESEPWRDKRAIVIGTGTSGHDIAQDLHAHGAEVTMVQRATTMVVNIEPSAQLPYTLYEEGPPLADCDLITVGTPLPLLKRFYQIITEEGRRIDQPLLERLEHRGFRLDFGEDGTGWQMKYLTRGGGYYFNVGCSDLIASGDIGLIQHADVEAFEAAGVRMQDGRLVHADLVVLATGYQGQSEMVSELLGDAVARRLGPIWGFGEAQELRNMFTATAQPGLWLIAGSFAQCRIYSKYLALQIKAHEAGLLR